MTLATRSAWWRTSEFITRQVPGWVVIVVGAMAFGLALTLATGLNSVTEEPKPHVVSGVLDSSTPETICLTGATEANCYATVGLVELPPGTPVQLLVQDLPVDADGSADTPTVIRILTTP